MLSVTTRQIDRAIEALKVGKVIVFPTETSYGIGCDATNEKAVARIFDIKMRNTTKALPIILPSVEGAYKYVLVGQAFDRLAQRYWPGALNIIAPINPTTPVSKLCTQNGTQSVRVSSHPFAGVLAKRFGKPIVATSANISGRDAIYSIEEVNRNFSKSEDRPDVIIDGGDLPKLPSSTTISVKGELVEVLRQGSVVISGGQV